MERVEPQAGGGQIADRVWPAIPSGAEIPAEETSRGSRILVVHAPGADRDRLWAMLREDEYRIVGADRGSEALALISRREADLVLLAGGEDEMEPAEFCRRVKSDRRTELIPIVVLNGTHGMEQQIAAVAAGADEFVNPPLHPDMLRSRIRALLRHKMATDRLEESEAILFALARAVEQRDQYTAGHCERLAFASLALGMAVEAGPRELLALYRGGFLHDIGKVGLPDSILLKAGPLSGEEWQVMRTHPVRGEEICRGLKTLGAVLPIIRSHHEKWDGTGYPDGLSGTGIPVAARILQLADIYDALTTERPYKAALPPESALAIMQAETDRGWRDPELMALFLKLHRDVFARAAEYAADTSENFGSMQESLANLCRALSTVDPS